MTPYKQLQHFWDAYNKAKIRHEMLQSRQQIASDENKKLQKTLKLYMASVRRSFSVPRKCGFWNRSDSTLAY